MTSIPFIFAVLALIEGIRRVPRGAVVLQRVLFGPWKVAGPEERERVRLLSWWSPLMTTLVLAPRPTYAKKTVDDLRAALESRELYTALFDLRLFGVVELLVLVAGIPLALERFGTLGFLWAAGAVVVLCLSIYLTLVFSARALGKPLRAALRWALPFLSPFAAPRAAEALLAKAVGSVAPGVVTRALVPAAGFLWWIRPLVYDAGQGGDTDRRLLEGLNVSELRRELAELPHDAKEGAWCPRCGATFTAGAATTCSECDVPLVREAPAVSR